MPTRAWVRRLKSPPAPTETASLARVQAVLYFAGGALAYLSLALPHPSQSNETAIELLAAVALLAGAVLFWEAKHVPRWMIDAGLGFGTVLIALAIYYAEAAGVYSSMFVWIAAYSGLFLTLRAALAQLAWIIACYSAALLDIHDRVGYSPVTRVLVTAIALGVVIFLTSWLVARRQVADERSQRFFELSRDMLCTVNADGCFVELNRAWTDYLGYSAEELRSRPFIEFVHPDDRERTAEETRRLFADDGHVTIGFENRYRAKDGSWRWLIWSAQLSPEAGVIFARATDITEARHFADQREQLLAETQSMAKTDPLTGVPNRRWLDEEIEREMARARRHGLKLGVAMVDLDHFKRFNDQLGHPAGDAFLQRAAEKWRGAMRSSDFLARYGGEEFVMVLPDVSEGEARSAVDRVRDATPGAITASAGIAFWDGDEQAEALIARADTALYEAKQLGRNRTAVAGSEVRT